MISEDVIQQFRDTRDRNYHQAKRKLSELQADLDRVVLSLDADPPDVRRSFLSGGVLGENLWADAERALIRYCDAATDVTCLEAEAEAAGSWKVLNSFDDIPSFDSEAEESEFWGTHQLGPAILAQMKRWPEANGILPTPRGKPTLVAVGNEYVGPSLAAHGLDLEEEEARNRVIADAYFEPREPGSVLEDEYSEKLDDIARARNYLRTEECYRVELNKPFAQNSRINWVEAASEEDAGSGWAENKTAKKAGVYVISVRRATEADLEEFLEAE